MFHVEKGFINGKPKAGAADILVSNIHNQKNKNYDGSQEYSLDRYKIDLYVHQNKSLSNPLFDFS